MTMDMGPLNLGIWKAFEIKVTGSPKSGYSVVNYFTFEGFIINVLGDVPHLAKAVRNAYYKFVLIIHQEWVDLYELKTNKVEFIWIKKMVNFDAKRAEKVAPHLSKKILDLGKHSYGKMKVAPALKVFCRETASGLGYLNKEYPTELLI